MHVVVTGASSGIGAAIAREFGRRGNKLTLIARRRAPLDELSAQFPGQTNVIVHDLSIRARCTEWLEAAEREHGPIDVMINNAGVQIIGKFWDAAPEDIRLLMDLNLFAPLEIMRALAPAMVARRSGTIVNIASVSALAATPFMSAYSGSKAGLAAASEALRVELKKQGVHVLTVYPGPIQTPMADAGYAAYGDSLTARLSPIGRPEVLATRVADAVARRKARTIYPRVYSATRYFPGITQWILDRFAPEPVANPISK